MASGPLAGSDVKISRIVLDAPESDMPLWLYLSLLILGLFASYLLQNFLSLWLLNRSVISWWQRGATAKKYNRYMSIWLVLAASSQGSRILSFLFRIFYAPNANLSRGQMIFLRQKLLPLRRFTDPSTKKQAGLLTPDHLCNSLLLFSDDGDDAFDAWLAATKPPRKVGKRCVDCSLSDSFYLTFKKPQDPTQQWWDYNQPEPLAGEANTYGVYPEPSSIDDWKGCIQAWMNGGLGSTQTKGGSYWVWEADSSMEYLVDKNNKNDDSAWWDVKSQPDNVFARCGIRFDSPLIVGFVNQKYYFKNVSYPFSAQAFSNLLGAAVRGAAAGGWVGFLVGLGDSSYDAYQSMCFDSIDIESAGGNQPPCNKVANQWGAGLTSAGLGAAFTAGVIPKSGISDVINFADRAHVKSAVGFWGVLAASAAMLFMQVSEAKDSC